MNRFAIFYALPLLCISFAPAQAAFRKFSKLEDASIDDDKGARTLSQKDLCLFRMTDEEVGFSIRDKSNKLSDDFPIKLLETIVTETQMMVGYNGGKITMTFHENAFKVYGKLYSLSNFHNPFQVKEVSLGGSMLQNVSIVKAKKLAPGEWLFLALDGRNDAMRLIFPWSQTVSYSRIQYDEASSRASLEFGAVVDKPFIVFFHDYLALMVFNNMVMEVNP